MESGSVWKQKKKRNPETRNKFQKQKNGIQKKKMVPEAKHGMQEEKMESRTKTKNPEAKKWNLDTKRREKEIIKKKISEAKKGTWEKNKQVEDK